jgi:hypothetical protein
MSVIFAGLEVQLAEVNKKLEVSCAEANSLKEEKLALKSACEQLESDILREKDSARSATREMNLAQAQSSHMQLQVCHICDVPHSTLLTINTGTHYVY